MVCILASRPKPAWIQFPKFPQFFQKKIVAVIDVALSKVDRNFDGFDQNFQPHKSIVLTRLLGQVALDNNVGQFFG